MVEVFNAKTRQKRSDIRDAKKLKNDFKVVD